MAAKRSNTKAASAKSNAPKPPTKTQILAHLAEQTQLNKKDVVAVLDALAEYVAANLKPRAAGEVTLPGLVKIKAVKKPATKERKGVNPFTREEMTIAAKPAYRAVKVQALKALKDMV